MLYISSYMSRLSTTGSSIPLYNRSSQRVNRKRTHAILLAELYFFSLINQHVKSHTNAMTIMLMEIRLPSATENKVGILTACIFTCRGYSSYVVSQQHHGIRTQECLSKCIALKSAAATPTIPQPSAF